MNRVIHRYINNISTFKELNSYGEEKDTYTFYGDGQGDFESSGDETTLECLYAYRTFLLAQLKVTGTLIR